MKEKLRSIYNTLDQREKFVLALYISILISPVIPVLILAWMGIQSVVQRQFNWKVKAWPEGFFLLLMAISLLSWVLEPVYYYGIPIVLIPMLTFFLYYTLSLWVKSLGWTWRQIQRVYLLFWLLGLYPAVVATLQRLGWFPMYKEPLLFILGYYPLQNISHTRVVATALNSNLAAAMFICLALISIYAAYVLTVKWQKWFALACFFFYCTTIWFTGSRGAWVGLLIGLLVQVWMTGNRKRTVGLFLSLVGLAALVYTNRTLIPREETLFATAKVRIGVWQNSFQIFLDHWALGTLPLRFGQLFYERTGDTINHAHNTFLSVASEYGVAGFVGFCLLVVLTISRARRWRKDAILRVEKRLAGMLTSVVVALLSHGMYDHPIQTPQIGLLFFFSVILIHDQYERSRPHKLSS
ncbi:O-antigen ligase [Mechercharimyces sp. CAU 1602]|uniref:O-antigen ligase family protein n=1 Tax=Mechercharimyces sp. CAU 1602 TaxID=2973933 RepID=UPI002162673D|nr:O-antigen ligase family protein [Mechercharimyces sp. CAU 1602]MCS1352040.1 O-antigen ligase family protein [Mechercharimyces sp. CAU 1602]